MIDLEQREVALAFFRRTDAAGDVVAGAQVEAADLARANVNIVRAGEIRLVRTAQEAEAVLQDFQHAFGVNAAAGARVRLQDQEDDVLLARAGDAFLDAEFVGELQQFGRGLALEFVEIDERTVAAAVAGIVGILIGVLLRLEALLVVVAAAGAARWLLLL